MAVYRGDTEIAELLLKYGANANKKSGGQSSWSRPKMIGNKDMLATFAPYQMVA